MPAIEKQTITVLLNGVATSINSGLTIHDFLLEQGWQAGRFIVVVNDDILPKSAYDDYRLSASERIDVLSPITGG